MRAFVLSGGASLGAVQAGMLRALLRADLTPDLVVGTSVGALNGALLAADPTVRGAEGISRVWHRLRRRDVFRVSPVQAVSGAAGRRGALFSSNGLGRLIDDTLAFDRLEDAPVPLRVVATDLSDGSRVVLRSGPARDALLASSAIPGVLPPVPTAGRTLVDGAVCDNAAISEAVAAGADEVWVLPSGYPCALPAAPRGALGVALQAVTLLVGQRLLQDLAHDHGRVVHLVPPLCPVDVLPHDFSRSDELGARAADSTTQWLAAGTPGGAGRRLTPHGHPRVRAATSRAATDDETGA